MPISFALNFEIRARQGQGIPVAAHLVPTQGAIDSEAKAAGGELRRGAAPGYLEQFGAAGSISLGDPNAGEGRRCVPTLGAENLAQLTQRNAGLPSGRGSAQAVGIAVLPGQITGSLLWPHGTRCRAHAAAVLGVKDMRPLAARPQCFPGCLAHRLLHFRACLAQAKSLAMGAIAESKAFGLVTVVVYQGESAHG